MMKVWLVKHRNPLSNISGEQIGPRGIEVTTLYCLNVVMIIPPTIQVAETCVASSYGGQKSVNCLFFDCLNQLCTQGHI